METVFVGYVCEWQPECERDIEDFADSVFFVEFGEQNSAKAKETAVCFRKLAFLSIFEQPIER
jgi:hypothetical protein